MAKIKTWEEGWEHDKDRVLHKFGGKTFPEAALGAVIAAYAAGFTTGWAEGESEAGRDGYQQGREEILDAIWNGR